MLRTTTRLIATGIVSATLAGCGLAETGVATATGAAAEAQQAKQAKQIEAQVQSRIDAAAQQDAERRRAADAESQ